MQYLNWHLLLFSDIHGLGISFGLSPPGVESIGQRTSVSYEGQICGAVRNSRGRVYPDPVGGNYPCPDCDKMFASDGSRWNHVAAIHDKLSFTSLCGKTFNYRHNLARHKKTCPICMEMGFHHQPR